MKKILCALLLLCSTSLLAFPYHVSQDVLDDIDTYEARYNKNPTSNEAIFELAMAYAYSGQVQEGLDKLNKLNVSYADVVIATYSPDLNKDKSDWRTPFKLGFAYYFKKDKHRAIELFDEAYKRNNKQYWSLGYKALVYGELGNVDEAIRICKQALKIEKNATAIHFLLADGYKRKKKYFKALKHILNVG